MDEFPIVSFHQGMKALHARLPGVALVLLKQHLGDTASLELRMHPDRVDSGRIIGND